MNKSLGQVLNELDLKVTKTWWSNMKMNKQYHEKVLKVMKHECSKPDWDAYGAYPIDDLTFLVAKNFLSVISLRKKSLLTRLALVPENTGSICFEWFESIGNRMEVIIKKDNVLFYFNRYSFHKGTKKETRVHGSATRTIASFAKILIDMEKCMWEDKSINWDKPEDRKENDYRSK